MAGTSSVYLGQYTDDNAEAIAARLEDAGISWWHKRAGALTRFVFAGEWGTRLFVAADREDEARAIAEDVTG